MKMALLLCAAVLLTPIATRADKMKLTDLGTMQLRDTQAKVTAYDGIRALRLTESRSKPGQLLAVLRDRTFHNGTIDIDIAGGLSSNAAESDRGFIGIAFHMQPDGSRYECIYIRPTNGRAQDQLRRNHSTEYESLPDWPWSRLRKQNPGVYESYADMVAGEWIHMKIVVDGTKAALYLAHATQPCLLINDLKLGDTRGAIALWGGSGTVGYFANLEIAGTK